jgi:hypothetical protein
MAMVLWIMAAESDESKALRMKDVYDQSTHTPFWYMVDARGQMVPAT